MPAKPTPIPWPTSSFPGANPQESGGRLINAYAEPLGDVGPGKWKYIRSAGLSLFAATENAGYRGGLTVNGLAYETWAGNASTVDAGGTAADIGTGDFPGTQKISIAQNQAAPTPDVVAVDLDNGAYVLASASVLPAAATATIGGTTFNPGDIVALTFLNPALSITGSFPISVSYTLGAAETATTVAAGLTAAIIANTALADANLTATSVGAVITIDHQGSIGNQTSIVAGVSGTETPVATNIGTQTSTSGATCALTGVTAPAGSLIIVVVVETSGSAGGVADGTNGAYSLAASEQFNTAADIGAIYYFENSAALSAATITYTKGVSGSNVAMSAFYIVGAAAPDPAISAAASGASSVNPALVSGPPSATGEIIIAALMCLGAPTYTQSADFATPPVLASVSTSATLAGGVTLSTKGLLASFAPTLGTAEAWAAIIIGFEPASASETVTFDPVSGDLAGGQGTFGAFTGNPTPFNAGGILPEPNSVCFQDGYFFFTIGSGQIYASSINGLTVGALTFITVQAKADVQLLRGIAFSGLLLAFTTGSCEVWQDAAIPSPAFPYSRIGVLEVGLIQPNAIAGFDTGFSELIWVAQDFGVHWMTANQLADIKISPPDLDRLIEAEVRAGNTLEAGCYIAAGKKFWALSSPDWTWEFNLQTKKWNERWSLASSGIFGRWRATGGHPAFGKWLVGDEQSGDLLYVDDTNYTENGAVQLWRMESGPVKDFPSELRIARGDFNFVFGVGQDVGSVATAVTGAAAGTGGNIELAVVSTVNMFTNDVARVSSVAGTVEANGAWQITVVDATHILLQGSTFANAYTSGGSVVDLTSPPNAVAPQVAVSMSCNGGLNWGNPLLRSLGAQAHSRRQYVSVTNMGQAGSMGARWRLDVSDPNYVSFFGGTQSSQLRPGER